MTHHKKPYSPLCVRRFISGLLGSFLAIISLHTEARANRFNPYLSPCCVYTMADQFLTLKTRDFVVLKTEQYPE